jgi:hypothetical protein
VVGFIFLFNGTGIFFSRTGITEYACAIWKQRSKDSILVACPFLINTWTGLWGANSETAHCGRFFYFQLEKWR